jgi:raffinose/stachyose/melibiose transport system permease protein
MAKEITYKKLRHYWSIYLFVLPSVAIVAVLSYYPAVSAMWHAFFRWNGEDINYFVGALNFRRLMGSYWLWIIDFVIFWLTLIYSSKKDWWADFFRILGGLVVIIITAGTLAAKGWAYTDLAPGEAARHLAVSILFWGTLLPVLKLAVSDSNEKKWIYMLIPACFLFAGILRALGFSHIFAWSVIMMFLGFFLWLVPYAESLPALDSAKTFHAFAALTVSFWALGAHSGGDPVMWSGFYVVFILVLANIPRMIPSIVTAVVIHRLKSDKANYLYRVFFVVPLIIPGMVTLLLWKFFFEPNVGMFNKILVYSRFMDVLVWLDGALGWGGIFREGQMPVWLGNEHLVLPAFILWGFPWVGVVGVLIYLAGLQGISTSVYEAADLDGASAVQKFFYIEFPLILTQIRINMVLMIISTLQAYGNILILFGESGGPNGKLMVPGLYMFVEAFANGQAGFACAVGLVVFFFILLLTEINNRYVKVDK